MSSSSEAAQARRRLDQLVAAATGADRYADLALHLRRLTVDFAAPVGVDHVFDCGGVEMVTAAAGQRGVPVRSVRRMASAAVSDGAQVGGSVPGVLRGEVLLQAGGRWDRLRKEWAGPADKPRVLDLMESQVELVRGFAKWLPRYKARCVRTVGRTRDVRAMMGYGGRGSGKTWVCMALVLAAALEIPDSVCWFVVENRPASQEDVHETFLREIVGEGWSVWRGQPLYCHRLLNGSRIYEKSADEPSSLKAGRVDVVFINEGAKLPDTVYGYATMRTKDRGGGGLALIATNPPTPDKPRGVWVFRLHEQWREAAAVNKWFPLEVYEIQSVQNATIDRGADDDLAILLRAVSPQLASADGDGLMALPGERVIYAYDSVRHGQLLAPSSGDITAEFLRKHNRVGRSFQYLAGVDFQASFPHIVCVFFKVYGTVEKPILWAVSDRSVKGNEDDFLDEVLHEGVRTGEAASDEIEMDTVLWIGDSSAQQQNSKHDFAAPPSFPAFLNRNLRIMSPTSPVTKGAKYGRNPSVGVSLGQVNSWFKADRIMVSPLAPHLAEDCRDGIFKETDRGLRPDKPHSHYLDCLRYVAWFVSPPTKRRSPGQQGGQARDACHAVP